ncbi:hypothetical protein [Rhizobium sp. P007]|jgi:hypothetical protein|uniref:hypothetical protein n=1 Tax=Rhizobium sp. P007 TaxID=285908 RepID=UPI00163CAE74|nr:hypothetical protein [Rhizobium sp. P007]
MFPDQVDDIRGWSNEGGITDRIKGAHDRIQLLYNQPGIPGAPSLVSEKRLVAKGNFPQELVYVCQLPVVFIEHRWNMHDFPRHDQLGDYIDGDIEPPGNRLDIAEHMIGQTEHDGRLSHPV